LCKARKAVDEENDVELREEGEVDGGKLKNFV
jgi:hypothetical protein